jgi:hypothetical protein
LRARVGAARIIAVLEPRSNTMRLGVHREQLAPALALADAAWFLNPPDLGWDLPAAVAALGDARISRRPSMRWSPNSRRQLRAGDHVLVMSNGGFGGLHEKLLANCARAPRPRRRAAGVVTVDPLFPLNIVLFPGGPLPLRIFETRYVDMVRRCMRETRASAWC